MERDLGALAAREHDLLVVGGGSHGAAAAWEAAHRGLGVALVEAEDFGCGASWNSLKTIHGGLRHLQRLDVAGLRESMRERRALLRIAQELVRPLGFLVPAFGHGAKGREALALGLWLNDRLTPDRNAGLPDSHRLPSARRLGREEVLALVPELAATGLTGGALWYDAQVASSERLVMGWLHAAAGAGAALANRARVVSLLRCRERVVGALVQDAESGRTHEVRSRCVLLAAGAATDALLALAQLERVAVPLQRATNLVFDVAPRLPHALGARSGGRFLFLVPWAGRVMAGTDYEPATTPDRGTEAFLAAVRAAFPWAGLTTAEPRLVHRGLVPGTSGSGLWSRHRVLDHEREDGRPGLVSLVSVKYTTARAAAEQAVDLVAERLGHVTPPSRSATLPLPRARPLVGTPAERVRAAVSEEMALHLSDLVLRRLDLGTAGPPAAAELEPVAAAAAAELGWDAGRLARERAELAAALRAAGC